MSCLCGNSTLDCSTRVGALFLAAVMCPYNSERSGSSTAVDDTTPAEGRAIVGVKRFFCGINSFGTVLRYGNGYGSWYPHILARI